MDECSLCNRVYVDAIDRTLKEHRNSDAIIRGTQAEINRLWFKHLGYRIP